MEKKTDQEIIKDVMIRKNLTGILIGKMCSVKMFVFNWEDKTRKGDNLSLLNPNN